MAESNVSSGEVVSSGTLQPGQDIHENEDPTTSYGTTLSGSEPNLEYLVAGDRPTSDGSEGPLGPVSATLLTFTGTMRTALNKRRTNASYC